MMSRLHDELMHVFANHGGVPLITAMEQRSLGFAGFVAVGRLEKSE